MKRIKEEIEFKNDYYKSLDYYLDSKSFAIIDIETTGLSPAYNSIILVGIIIVDNDDAILHQYFATGPDDELEILSYTARLLSQVNHIVTFNGRMFDIPFIEKRCLKHGIQIDIPFNLDLFVLLKHYSDLPKFLPRMNQKTVEQYAGIDTLRQDKLSGGDSVLLYNQYLESSSMDLEKRILLHNSDDVKQLLRLRSLIVNTDIHRAFNKTGFPIKGGKITGIELKKADLRIKGICSKPSEYISFPSIETPYHFQMSGKDGGFTIDIPCESKKNNVYLDLSFMDNYEDKNLKDIITLFPSYINNYLILKEDGKINYPPINLLSRIIAEQAIKNIQT